MKWYRILIIDFQNIFNKNIVIVSELFHINMDGKNEGNHEGHKSFRELRFIYTILQDIFQFFQKREMSLNFTINFPVLLKLLL